MYWLLGSKSRLSIESKLLLYKAILKPIWIYGVQLWGIVADSNVEIIQRFQNKYLRIIVNAPWYVTNDTLQHLNVPYARDEIKKLRDTSTDWRNIPTHVTPKHHADGRENYLKTYLTIL